MQRARAARVALANALTIALAAGGLTVGAAPLPAAAAGLCAAAGADGAGGTLSGVVNTYFPGLSSAGAGSTAIAVGPSAGASHGVAPGDLLLVVQMQNATLNTNNTTSYGSGGSSASGYLTGTAGTYEYVVARSAIGSGGGTIAITGTGGGNGLVSTYYESAASSAQGQQAYQVVRVPQYTSATVGTLSGALWNGATGGVLALDVSGTLTGGGGTASVSALGFRGGGRQQLSGIPTGATATDYVNVSGQSGTIGAHASKGEGIAGTPRLLWNGSTETDLGTSNEGYPGGSFARGAPANAGGGGTDSDPTANDQNSGGGGGGNGGVGGGGGDAWNSNAAVGGIGGAAFAYTASSPKIVMGGGGGAGVSNNGTNAGSAPGSMGGPGGGLIFIRTGTTAGNATFSANGGVGTEPINDGGGGGGAGGAILFIGNTVGLLTSYAFSATGGAGSNANNSNNGKGAHGPGGGGAGGALLTNANALLGSTSVTGGANGVTYNNNAFGATSGASGYSATTVTAASVPGAQAGYACTGSAFINVTKTAPSTAPPGGLISYSVTVSNSGPAGANNTTFSDPMPTNIAVKGTPTCAASGGAACGTVSVGTGSPTTVSSTITTLPSGGSVTFTIETSTATNASYTNTATIAPATGVTDGNTTTTSSATTTVAASYGPSKTVQNITTGESSAGTADNASPGDTLQYALSFTNSTNVPISSFKFTDPTPTNTTYVSAACGTLPSGVTSCTVAGPAAGAAGTVTWTFAGTLAAGSTVTATLRVKVN